MQARCWVWRAGGRLRNEVLQLVSDASRDEVWRNGDVVACSGERPLWFEGKGRMGNIGVDELGPVDWIVVEFAGGKFNGKIAPALHDLIDRDLVRVLDLLVLKKDPDGSLKAFEISDLEDGEVGELRSHQAQLAMLLGEDDVAAVSDAIEPGTSAGVLVWENTWAAPFASAVRHSGGQLVASGRISVQALFAVLDEDTKEEAVNGEIGLPLAGRPIRRAAVIGPASVARTETTAATASVVAHNVNRRTDRRDGRRRG